MNINIGTFLTQCAAMGVWVFLVAGVYALVEKLLDKHVPGFLDVEEAGASQSPGPVQTPAPVRTDTAETKV
jgi:hypothetical protein